MLALIPARKGSKGLPGKNTALLNGIPLIMYTIEAAKKSKKIKRIIVSSDDEKVISICKSTKSVEVPFKRPKYLASDNSILTDTLFHLFKWMKKNEGEEPKDICVLQPTSPLRLSKDIDQAIDLYYKTKADALLTVYETRPLFFKLTENKKLISISKKTSGFMLARQKIKFCVTQNGAIHIFNTQKLKKNKSYYTSNTFGFIMPEKRSVDIDTKLDFFIAEQILKNKLHM